MKSLTFAALMLLVSLAALAESSEKSQCRLTVHTILKSGHKKVDVMDVDAANQTDCAAQAAEKRRELESKHDEDVKQIIISSGWSGPS